MFENEELNKFLKIYELNADLERFKKLRNFFHGKMNKFTINNVVIFKKLKCINLIRENRNIQFELEVFKNKILFLTIDS